MLLNNMFFVFSSCLNGNHNTKISDLAVKYKGAKNNIGKGLSGQSYAIPVRKHKMEYLNERRVAFEINDFFDYARKNPQMQFQITNLIAEHIPLKKEKIIPLFNEKPLNCHISGQWNTFLKNPEKRVVVYIDDEIKSSIKEESLYECINYYIKNLRNVIIVHNDTLKVKNYSSSFQLPEVIIPKNHLSFSSEHLANIFNIRDLLWYGNNIILITNDKNKLLIKQIEQMSLKRNINIRIVDYS